MSEINEKDHGRQVPQPDIYPLSRHVGIASPNGPRNRVCKLEVVPFSQYADENWQGKDAFVLTLWTDRPQRSPFRFCFSAEALEALEAMEEESRNARNGQLSQEDQK